MTDTADVARRLALRSEQLADRLEELRLRRLALTASRACGSDRAQALRAAELAALARRRAAQAEEYSIRAHLTAADVHEETARRLTDLAGQSLVEAGRWLRRAGQHRKWAEAQRLLARQAWERRSASL